MTFRRALRSTLVALIAGLFALRLYAALATVPIRTWDDSQFREMVDGAVGILAANHAGLTDSLSIALAPASCNDGFRRSIGYTSWLLVGREAFPQDDPEQVYQITNTLGLLLQAALVLALFRPAGITAALCAVALYLTMPFVFGLNRWVWTENHVMLSLLGVAWAASWLLACRRSSWVREALVGVAAGVCCALFSRTREYAAPTILLVPALIVFSLLIARRFAALAAFALVVVPYLAMFAADVLDIAKMALTKMADDRYYLPLWGLFLFAVRHVFGLSVFLLLITASAAAAVRGWQAIAAERWAVLRKPAALLLVAHLFLATAYALILVLSSNRNPRVFIPIGWSLIAAVAFALRVAPIRVPVRIAVLTGGFALASACGFLSYDLFIAYDGGASYAAHAYELGSANYPLHLRALRGKADMHVVY